ncbi:MAG: PQQ-like beta-propeller repeat protein [Verrucomicrobiales bacterium]|nr:PQQ-like beta-propeller repeat protein [Verrucomicrobiales bacterium]
MRTTRHAIGMSAPFGLAAIMIMVCFTSRVRAVDWSQYNGPLGDVSSPESIRTNWTAQPPKVLWRQSIGPGWSSISTGGGRLFTQARRQTAEGPREFCVALDAVTGAELWARDLDVSDYTDISQTDRRADGPRSTPTVSGDFVYVYTSQLRLYCLAAADGSLVWSRDFREELGSQNIPWENAASPLLVGDLIYLNSNGGSRRLTAINKNDGKTVWSNLGDRLTHATPIYATLHGVPQVVFLTRSGLVSVLPDTGALLWRLEFSPSSTSTAASPSVAGDYVYASAAYGSGTWIGRVTKNGETFSASLVLQQQATEYQAHWATPVAKEGFFYAVPAPNSGQGRLACLEAATAVNRWTRSVVGSSEISYGSVIKAANTLIVLTEGGELVLVEANPKAYTETARFKVLSAYCWNRPVLANGRIYVRNSAVNSEIVALDVSPPSVPVPPLTLSASIGTAGVLELLIQAVDGTPLNASHLDRLQLVTSVDVGTAREAWSAMDQSLTVTDRGIRAGVTLLPEQARFITVRVKP